MSSRLLSGAGALAVILFGGDASVAKDQNLEPVGKLQKLQKARAAPSIAASRPRTAALGASVDGLLALARSLNPGLAAAALESEAAINRIVPAGSLPDPTFNVTRDQGFRNTMLTVSQEFPLWGKLELRAGVAQAEATAAKAREGSVLIELLEQVKVVFAQYYAAEHSIRATEEIYELLRTTAGAAQARYAQGTGSLPDAVRAELERTRLDPVLSALQRDAQIAKAKINALVGRQADASLAAPVALRKVPGAASLKLGELVARARLSNPKVAEPLAEIAAAEGERELVDRSYYPDPTVTAGYDAVDPRGPRIVVGIGTKIPLQWGTREAQAREAIAKKGSAQARLDEAILKIESDLTAALASLKQAQRTKILLANVAQQSQTAYQAAFIAYQNGQGDLTAVLDAARQVLDVRLQLFRVETEEQAALAAIERLVGADL